MANDQHTELDSELTLEQVKEQLIEFGKKTFIVDLQRYYGEACSV